MDAPPPRHTVPVDLHLILGITPTSEEWIVMRSTTTTTTTTMLDMLMMMMWWQSFSEPCTNAFVAIASRFPGFRAVWWYGRGGHSCVKGGKWWCARLLSCARYQIIYLGDPINSARARKRQREGDCDVAIISFVYIYIYRAKRKYAGIGVLKNQHDFEPKEDGWINIVIKKKNHFKMYLITYSTYCQCI